MNRIIIDNRTDLVDYSYFLTLNIYNINNQTNKLVRQIKVVNLYDN